SMAAPSPPSCGLTSLESMLLMPGQVDRVGPKLGVARQANPRPVVLPQPLLVRAVFGKPVARDQDLVIRTDRPQPFVEEPMAVLAQGQAVAQVVVPRIGELMNVRRIHDAGARDCR